MRTNHRMTLPGLALWAGMLCGLQPAFGAGATGPQFDIVLTNARAIDPETGLDAVRNIGLRGGSIAAVTTEAIKGKRTIDAKGLVAAPGFIDLHSHAYGYETATYQAKDGVTTRLELESGVFPVKGWYENKAGRELINYGASVSHLRARYAAQRGGTVADPRVSVSTDDAEPGQLIFQPIPPEAYSNFIPLLDAGLTEGAIGIGSATQYAPGITLPEMFDLTDLAAKRHMCVLTHIRFGSLVEPDSTLEAVQEQVANAAVTGGCVHIVHINSMAMSQTPYMLRLFHRARERGIDVSTEIYPWDGSTDQIRSTFFENPGFR